MISFKFITWILNAYLMVLFSGSGNIMCSSDNMCHSGTGDGVDASLNRRLPNDEKEDIVVEDVTSDSDDDDWISVGGGGDGVGVSFKIGKPDDWKEDIEIEDVTSDSDDDEDYSGGGSGSGSGGGHVNQNEVKQPTSSGSMGQSEIDGTGYCGSGGGSDADLPSNGHHVTKMSGDKVGEEDDEDSIQRKRVAELRDEGRTFYIIGAYRDSVMCYTEAVRLQTTHFHYLKNDAILAALYGNRSAALLMTGAYEAASADCERALACIDSNSSIAYESLESGPAFRSKIICRKARGLLKVGNVCDAEKEFNNSIQSARGALALIGHQSRSGTGGTTSSSDGTDGAKETFDIEKILNQSIKDATLGLLDAREYRDAIECANATEKNKAAIPADDRKNNLQLLMSLNSALSVSPGSIELHERKVNTLATLKRWAELGNHCESVAAETVKLDGLFTEDLASLDPFPDVPPAQSLKPDFFEKNSGDLLRKLSPTAVCEAVIRMPNGILRLYLRSLRLEERFTEAAKAGAILEAHMSESKHSGNRGNVSISWLFNESDKLRRTMSWKEMGDISFRTGDYERAGEKYAQCLSIDNDMTYNLTSLVNENAGGRLHAVLHCNRAACLMSLKRYHEAVKECTAALRIHDHYMKAMLRRGRCFARIRQYEKAIAEYERYIQLVIEARKSPQHASNSYVACTFDRPTNVTEGEYNMVKLELVEVKKSMRNADTQDEHISDLRDEGRASFLEGAYLDSVLSYTEAIRLRTAPPFQDPTNDEILAALYGNRAAALLMAGAYEGASADCERASLCIDPSNANDYIESGPAFQIKILCRMAQALLKAGSVCDAEKAFNDSIQSAREALVMLRQQSQSVGVEVKRGVEKILNQSITDATTGLSDVQKYRDAIKNAIESSDDQLLASLNSALSVSPGSIELHERKVGALASLKRWAELGNHCERLAAVSVNLDGLFIGDLASLDPFPDVRPAQSLKPDFFEKNQDDLLDPPSMRKLSPKAVCEAVIRMPNGILPTYLRSLRLEERITEADKAGTSLKMQLNENKHKGSRGNVNITWLSTEREKLQRTKSSKEAGDRMFSDGDYERALEKYAQCLSIDNGTAYSNSFVRDNTGGRLHAVLHCNRAACLMALKKYHEAAKECTVALRIHTHYMKALLRRGRSFAKILKYEKSIADYEKYIELVIEARKSPHHAANCNAACTFDRPIDVTDAMFDKVKQELVEVKKAMRNAAEERDQHSNFHQSFHYRQRQRQQQQRRHHYQQRHQNHYQQQQQQQNHYQNHYRRQHHYQQQYHYQYNYQEEEEQQQEQPSSTPTETVDHYQVLELLPTATAAEIKKAYHKMALKYHPDKNPAENAAEMFRRAKDAYDVLGNEQSRSEYDSLRR
ncbi:hypothetical protein ACHAXH_004791 [Discostella pseudostelligera]